MLEARYPRNIGNGSPFRRKLFVIAVPPRLGYSLARLRRGTSGGNTCLLLYSRHDSGSDQCACRWRWSYNVPLAGVGLAAGDRRRHQRVRLAYCLPGRRVAYSRRIDQCTSSVDMAASHPQRTRRSARSAAAELVRRPKLRRPSTMADTGSYPAAPTATDPGFSGRQRRSPPASLVTGAAGCCSDIGVSGGALRRGVLRWGRDLVVKGLL